MKNIIFINSRKKRHCHILEHQTHLKEAFNLATSSFSKTFVFNSDAAKKIQDIRNQPGMQISSYSSDRIKEGKEALARFSSPSKR